jgi:hypothetical protein
VTTMSLSHDFACFQTILSYAVALVLIFHVPFLMGLPMEDDNDQFQRSSPVVKRSDGSFLLNGNFSLVTSEKLQKLKELANEMRDPRLQDLYLAVHHYVQMAQKNNEYVLWKYDTHQEGLVLALKQNLSGILYYG